MLGTAFFGNLPCLITKSVFVYTDKQASIRMGGMGGRQVLGTTFFGNLPAGSQFFGAFSSSLFTARERGRAREREGERGRGGEGQGQGQGEGDRGRGGWGGGAVRQRGQKRQHPDGVP